MEIRGFWVVLSLLALACSSGNGAKDAAAPDSATTDLADGAVNAEVVAVIDINADDAGKEDIVQGSWYGRLNPRDDLFRVGVSSGLPPAPIGIPTAGYGEATSGKDPRSPFAKAFAATTTEHTPIRAKSVYLWRGMDEFLLIRMDKIGTTSEFLDEFTRRLEKKTGRSWDGKVVLASNHTHLGPGRLWENMIGEFANDQFWPQYYIMFLNSLVDIAIESIKDAEPASFGYGVTSCPECHQDRRCESPEMLDSTMWVVRLDGADGTPKVVLLNFAIHGTVFGWQDYTLSGDAPGIMEEKLEETFDTPVEVLMLQSWGGDVAPSDPEVEMEQPPNKTIRDKYDRLERIGHAAALHVNELLPQIETTGEVKFVSNTIRPPIAYELLGYEAEEWDYTDGGMMCGTNSDAPCWGEDGPEPNMACLPMPPDMAPLQFVLSAFRINDLFFFTLPGEPHTDLSLETIEAVKEATGYENIVLVGYAQDHWGYLMKEYDWLLGGYEPTVSFWGPKQGQYMADKVPFVAKKLVEPEFDLPFEPLPPLPTVKLVGDKYSPMDSIAKASVKEQPDGSVGQAGAARATWAGGDPWFGTPLVVLEKQEGSDWQEVIRQNGRAFTNRGYLMETGLKMLPTWKDDKESTKREFLWTVTLPARRNVPCPDSLVPGTYRLRITGQIQLNGTKSGMELHSDPFNVE